MKRYRWEIVFGTTLVALSVLMFFGHYLYFRDLHHIAIYTVHDIAFLPMEVLLVTLVLHRLLESREKRHMLKKLNMVIGAFFSEVGTEFMCRTAKLCAGDELRKDLVPAKDWTAKRFAAARARLLKREYRLEVDAKVLADLKPFLRERRQFLLALLENPNLLEHESFTNVLWAVFHLMEELEHRGDLAKLSASDVAHITGDVKRVYAQILAEWITYMGHLKADYPYLYSLAARTNPFDAAATVEVTA